MFKNSFLLFFLINTIIFSQEINCRVSLNYSSIPSANKEMFNSMRQSINEFMNTTKWTNDIFSNEERIDCTILIRINQQISTDEFSVLYQFNLQDLFSKVPIILLSLI